MSAVHIKVREKGRKSWAFLTSGGCCNRLRIHAASFPTKEAAQALIDENASRQPRVGMEGGAVKRLLKALSVFALGFWTGCAFVGFNVGLGFIR